MSETSGGGMNTGRDSPTDAEVQEMLARAEAATPEPWRNPQGATWTVTAGPPTTRFNNSTEVVGGKPVAVCPEVVAARAGCGQTPVEAARNARFIASARSDVPVLARAVLRLRRERDLQQKGWLETLAREREWFKERDALRESLLEMTGDVEWMSGSPDFAPGDCGANVPAGQAHEGWRKVQVRLARALKLLEENYD